MPCTNEKPCLAPILRWVHSQKCRDATRSQPNRCAYLLDINTRCAEQAEPGRLLCKWHQVAPSEHGGGERCEACGGSGGMPMPGGPIICRACGGTGRKP